MQVEPKIIEIKDVSFSYEKKEKVLHNISLDVRRGDYLGLIGPNGAGKTTLLKIMLGLLRPDSGSASLFGVSVEDFKDWSKIGYVPQKATSFDVNFPVTVLDVVMMGRYGDRSFYSPINKEDREIAKNSLVEVGMWDYKDRLIGDLSGGQQQRVFIARALASKPEIIFLDEPTIGIDKKTEEEFYSLLKKLNTEMNLTLVLVSHDIQKIAEEAKYIACIDKTLVCHSSPEEFFAETESRELFGQKVKIMTPHRHD